jgi:hypothetical protein
MAPFPQVVITASVAQGSERRSPLRADRDESLDDALPTSGRTRTPIAANPSYTTREKQRDS